MFTLRLPLPTLKRTRNEYEDTHLHLGNTHSQNTRKVEIPATSISGYADIHASNETAGRSFENDFMDLNIAITRGDQLSSHNSSNNLSTITTTTTTSTSGSPLTTTTSSTSPATSENLSTLSFEERRRLRALRFGVPLDVSIPSSVSPKNHSNNSMNNNGNSARNHMDATSSSSSSSSSNSKYNQAKNPGDYANIPCNNSNSKGFPNPSSSSSISSPSSAVSCISSSSKPPPTTTTSVYWLDFVQNGQMQAHTSATKSVHEMNNSSNNNIMIAESPTTARSQFIEHHQHEQAMKRTSTSSSATAASQSTSDGGTWAALPPRERRNGRRKTAALGTTDAGHSSSAIDVDASDI